MPTEQPRSSVAARASALHRLIARSAAALVFSEGVLRIEARHGSIDIPFADVDDVREQRSWIWTRLTIHTTADAQHTIGGLPKRDAARLAAALRDEAARRAQPAARQLIAQQAELDRALSGERYLRYGDGEQLRFQSTHALKSASAAIIRAQLHADALAACNRLDALAVPDHFERARADANRTFVAATLPAVNDAMAASFAITPTDEQAAAIATDEDATLVLAGAGTGKTSVIADSTRPSPFVQELRRDQPAIPKLGAFAADDAPPCPRCGGRLVLSQTGKTRRCTNHPLRGYQARRCDRCSRGFLIVGGGRAECSNDACAAPVKACPRCGFGTLRLIEGPYSRFWGCTEYYAEPPCTYSRSAEPRAATGRT